MGPGAPFQLRLGQSGLHGDTQPSQLPYPQQITSPSFTPFFFSSVNSLLLEDVCVTSFLLQLSMASELSCWESRLY